MSEFFKNQFHKLANSRVFRRLWVSTPNRVKSLLGPIKKLLPSKTPWEKIPRVYPVLQCNLKCPFCSDGQDYDQSHMGYEVLPTEQWIRILDALDGEAVIFTGGEPTLHPGLPDVINKIHQVDIRIYTNLSYNVSKFFDRLEKPVAVFASFHPNNKGVTTDRMIENLKILVAHPMCRELMGIHTIDHPSNGNVQDHKRVFAEVGFELKVDSDQYVTNSNGPKSCSNSGLSTVRCRLDRFLIGPDGKRWICVSKMIRNVSDGLVTTGTDKIAEMICAEFGRCAPCDEIATIEPI